MWGADQTCLGPCLLVWGSSRAWHTAAVATEAGPLLVRALAPRRHVVQVGPHLVGLDAVGAQLLADEIRLGYIWLQAMDT